jgi:hypothetical protein
MSRQVNEEEYNQLVNTHKYYQYNEALLCQGCFNNRFVSHVDKTYTLLKYGTIVEQKEWDEGYVELEALERYIKSKRAIQGGWCGTCDDSIGKINHDIQCVPCDNSDLFICEKKYLTGVRDDEPVVINYIIIKYNYGFNIN